MNVKSDFPDRLPTTTNNKTGLKQDDTKLEEIYKWIKSKISEPRKRASLSDHEIDLFNQLKNLKLTTLKQYDSSLFVEREKHAFTSVGEKLELIYISLFKIKQLFMSEKKIKQLPKMFISF